MPLPPGLSRAITDSTSPFGSHPSADVLRNLEVYLADPRSTDAVYDGLVNRACAEPLSVPLVEKVVALLKAYLLRFAPSQDVVRGLVEFTARVNELPGLSITGRKAVAYVRSCLRQLGGQHGSGRRQSRGSSNSLGNLSAGRSREDLSRLAANGLTTDGRLNAMKVSVSSSALGQGSDRYPAADSLHSPTEAELSGPGHLLAWLRQSNGRSGVGPLDLRVSQGASRCEPWWAVPARPALLPPAPPAVTAVRARSWLRHLPDLAPRVTLAALVPDGALAGGAPVAAASLSLSGTPPISVATIHRCVLDLEEQDIGRHLVEVLGEARAEAQQQQPATPQIRQPAGRPGGRGAQGAAGGGAAGGRRSRPPRLLFHHPPYNRAERLPIIEADVAVVVEAVCGVRAASAMAAVMGPLADRAAEEAAGQAEGMWQAAFEDDGEFGQICGGILMKMLVDMWLRCEPQHFFIVVMRMLCRALRSTQPSTRARAFDVLYNLHVHGAMLRTDAEESALAAAAAEMGAGGVAAGGGQMPWQVCASAPVSPFISGGGGAGGGALTPPPAARGGPPKTPVTSTAEPLTPVAAGAGKPGIHHLVSHSLGLQGSALLDSGGDLAATSSGQVGSRGASKAGVEGGGATGRHHNRRDNGTTRLPPPPPSPTGSPSASPGVRATAPGGGGAAGTGAGGAAAYDGWLRALLFRLLYELQETEERCEEVWRGAMGCLAQMCSHGGHWVAPWVQHLPPSALAHLLQQAWALRWSHELYAQLLKLVPCVLLVAAGGAQHLQQQQQQQQQQLSNTSPRSMDSAFAAPGALKSATAAANADEAATALAAAAAAAETAAAAVALGSPEAEEMRRRINEFGGMGELLIHFLRAPTPDSRAALLAVLVQCCSLDVPAGAATSAPAGSMSPAANSEQGLIGAHSPRTSGSPGSRPAQDGGPSAVLAVLQSLHMDSVCLVLQAALERPWKGMSSRLADVLASANSELSGAGPHPLSPAGSMSGSAEYPGLHTLPAGVASPIAVRALLRPLLESLEGCCAANMALPQPGGELRTHMEVTVAHIVGIANASDPSGPPPPPVTVSSTAAAWEVFKEVCDSSDAWARRVAVQWLHKVLWAACRACQGQILLLSPLTLKTSPEISRIAAATAPGKAPNSPRALWNVALADALLHIVRESPSGCNLLLVAIARTVADLKGTAAPSDGVTPISPRLSAGLQGAAAAGAAAAAAAGADRMTEELALTACRAVMGLYYAGLQWMLQCGSAAARMPTVVELADVVLAALLQPDPAVAAAAAAAAGASGAPGAAAASSGASEKLLPNSSAGARAAMRTAAPTIATSTAAATAAGARASGAATPQPAVASGAGISAGSSQQQQQHAGTPPQEPGGGMWWPQQLLAGLQALDPDALACTPPELLVTLLQQCSQSLQDAGSRLGGGGAADAAGEADARGAGDGPTAGRTGGEAGFRSMHRGFLGRPCAMLTSTHQSPSGGGAGRPGAASLQASGAGVTSAAPDSAPVGAAVGPWQDDWQDRRLALLLLLIARCSLDPEAFAKYSLSHVIKAQLGCDDLRCRYYAGVYLLKHWMLNQHDKYWRTLRHIIGTAQQLNDERLLDNPYLQMRTMLNVDHA